MKLLKHDFDRLKSKPEEPVKVPKDRTTNENSDHLIRLWANIRDTPSDYHQLIAEYSRDSSGCPSADGVYGFAEAETKRYPGVDRRIKGITHTAKGKVVPFVEHCLTGVYKTAEGVESRNTKNSKLPNLHYFDSTRQSETKLGHFILAIAGWKDRNRDILQFHYSEPRKRLVTAAEFGITLKIVDHVIFNARFEANRIRTAVF